MNAPGQTGGIPGRGTAIRRVRHPTRCSNQHRDYQPAVPASLFKSGGRQGTLGISGQGAGVDTAPFYCRRFNVAEKTQKQLEEEAWEQIVSIATAHSMIVQAAGGTLTLVHPEIQRENHMRADCLCMSHNWTKEECAAAAERGE